MIDLKEAISIAERESGILPPDNKTADNVMLSDVCGEYDDRYIFYCTEPGMPDDEILNYAVVVYKADGKVEKKAAIDISPEDTQNNIKPEIIKIRS